MSITKEEKKAEAITTVIIGDFKMLKITGEEDFYPTKIYFPMFNL